MKRKNIASIDLKFLFVIFSPIFVFIIYVLGAYFYRAYLVDAVLERNAEMQNARTAQVQGELLSYRCTRHRHHRRNAFTMEGLTLSYRYTFQNIVYSESMFVPYHMYNKCRRPWLTEKHLKHERHMRFPLLVLKDNPAHSFPERMMKNTHFINTLKGVAEPERTARHSTPIPIRVHVLILFVSLIIAIGVFRIRRKFYEGLDTPWWWWFPGKD